MKIQTTLTKRWKLRSLLLAFVAVSLLGFVSFTQVQSALANEQTASDTAAIKNVVTDAFATSVTLLVVPDNTVAANALTPASSAMNLNDAVSMKAPTQSIVLAHSRVQNSFNHSFATDSLIGKNLYQEIQQTVDAQSKGRFRALGGGIRDIHWHSILIHGDDASVTVDATLWSRVKYFDESGKIHIVTPTTGYFKVYTLHKINGQWLVSSVVDDDLQADQLGVNQQTPGKVQGSPVTSQTTTKVAPTPHK